MTAATILEQRRNPYLTNAHKLCPNKNVTTLSRYNSDVHESILIIFGINVIENVDNQKVLYFPSSPN